MRDDLFRVSKSEMYFGESPCRALSKDNSNNYDFNRVFKRENLLGSIILINSFLILSAPYPTTDLGPWKRQIKKKK